MGDHQHTVQSSNPLSRSQLNDLQRLIRQRAALAKKFAVQRSAELKADFEEQISAIYKYDTNAVWQQATIAAQAAVTAADQKIAEECKRLGIPAEFRPKLTVEWWRRGENASRERRDELRKVAMAEIAAAEKRAFVEIDRLSLEAQTTLVASGLSGAARAFLDQLPSVEALMPSLDIKKLQTGRHRSASIVELHAIDGGRSDSPPDAP